MTDIKEIAAVWGAITGTLGLFVATYAVGVSRRRDIPEVAIDSVSAAVHAEKTCVRALFDLAVSNQGTASSSITGFSVAFDRGPSGLIRNTCNNYPSDGTFSMRHQFSVDPDGRVSKHKTGNRLVYGESIYLKPGEHVRGIRGEIALVAREESAEQTKVLEAALITVLRTASFRVRARLSNNRVVTFPGRSLEYLSQGLRKIDIGADADA